LAHDLALNLVEKYRENSKKTRKGNKRMHHPLKVSDSKQPATHIIDMLFLCPNACGEIQSSDPSIGECAVEELVSLALATFFESILIQDVCVIFPPANAPKDARISIALRAQGCDPLPIEDQTNLACAIEHCLSSVLLELFGSLEVERCLVA
jgi:hypothetical protein